MICDDVFDFGVFIYFNGSLKSHSVLWLVVSVINSSTLKLTNSFSLLNSEPHFLLYFAINFDSAVFFELLRLSKWTYCCVSDLFLCMMAVSFINYV